MKTMDWTQNQNNLMMGQAQFNPYINPNYWSGTSRAPVYTATPIHGENELSNRKN